MLTSADIKDGKTEYDPKTGATTKYNKIDGGYEMVITTPQPNGTTRTQVKTFWDPKPVSEEDLKREIANKKKAEARYGKEIRIDSKTTMLTRPIEGGYEEVYTTRNEDGTQSTQTKTFYDSVPAGTPFPFQKDSQQTTTVRNLSNTKKSSEDYSDTGTETRKAVEKLKKNEQLQEHFHKQSTFEESHHYAENIEISKKNRTIRRDSTQEQSIKSITTKSNTTADGTEKKKKTKLSKSSAPPPPPDFLQNDTTTVVAKHVPGGKEYTYTTTLESGKTISTSTTVYEEEDTELTEEEIRQYKKALKNADKYKNITTTKKLKSESGTKKIVPSDNPDDVTTVETIRIDGGTEYHYTTVSADGIVKKSVKTVFDPVPCSNPGETDEEEIVEEYEEEIIEPGEKVIKTIESTKKLPQKCEEEITITHEKKEKTVKKSMRIVQ